MWHKDAAIFNLKFMRDSFTHKEEGKVIRWVTDNAIKKPWHRVFKTKSNHITVKGPNIKKQFYTTDFDPNLSHIGYDSSLSI